MMIQKYSGSLKIDPQRALIGVVPGRVSGAKSDHTRADGDKCALLKIDAALTDVDVILQTSF